ncbi:MAG: chorismate synthase [Treponemataceae bacterium]|nr:chorismate synthase [Treponemataceae bacterium]
MSGNSFGSVFKVTTFGESHGAAIGAVIDGCPAGIQVDVGRIQAALDRRRPGAAVNGIASAAVTQRSEPDTAEICSGVFEGISEGTPIAILIRNTSQRSGDYSNLADTFRPGHADFTYDAKYGFRDYRGGGRASGRETAARVAAGAVAAMLLERHGIRATAYTVRAAGISCKTRDLSCIGQNSMRAPDNEAASRMEAEIGRLRRAGDSAGGIVECLITGVPAGLGEPVFDKLDAELAKAVLSIGAVKGVEFGDGFAAADAHGSGNNDPMRAVEGAASFSSNHAGGILGGISNGSDIVFRAAVKPVPSIFLRQQTVRRDGTRYADAELEIKGRHDVCLCPRIVPVVEAMADIVLADMLLRAKAARAG